MKNILFSLIVTLFLITSAVAETPAVAPALDARILDLQSACDIALANNPSLAAAEARVKAAAERVSQSRASYFPRIDATATAARINLSENDYVISLAQAKILDPDASINDPGDYYSAGITASWIVFNGFERHFSNLATKYGQTETKAARDDAHRLLLAAVAETFYRAQLGRENIAIAEADEAFNQRLAQEARMREQFGTGPLSDILNFEVQVNAARASVITARQGYDLALTGLAALLGFENAMFPANMDLARLSPEATERMLLPDLNNQMNYALTHRPDLVRADYTFKQADAAVNVASADMYPDIILSASATGDRVDDADFRNDDFGNTVALTINYNIFAGGLTRAQINEARANRMAAENMIANQRLEISSEVNKAMASLKASQEQLKLQRDNAKLVNKNRELVEKEYAAGQTSLVRLNEAQRNLVQAQGRLALARVSLDNAWYKLDVASGRNIEK
jgi:outer membrane protein